MKLRIITPQQKIFDDEVKQVSIPTESGEITVLPHHVPLTTVIKPWLIKILPTQGEKYTNKTFIFEEQYITLSSSDGIAYINSDEVIIMVTSSTINGSDIDEGEREKNLQQLEQEREEARLSNNDKKLQKTERKIQTMQASLKLNKMIKK